MTAFELAVHVYTTQWTATIRMRIINNYFTETPDDITCRQNLSRLPRRLVGGVGLEEDASADASGRASPDDTELLRSGRARASGQSVDRSRNPHPGHPQRHQ